MDTLLIYSSSEYSQGPDRENKKVTRGLQMSANVFIIIFTTWHATNKMQQTHSTDNSKDACNHLSNPQIQRKEIYTSNLAGFPKSLGVFWGIASFF